MYLACVSDGKGNWIDMILWDAGQLLLQQTFDYIHVSLACSAEQRTTSILWRWTTYTVSDKLCAVMLKYFVREKFATL